jgi:hypothetical protein
LGALLYRPHHLEHRNDVPVSEPGASHLETEPHGYATQPTFP